MLLFRLDFVLAKNVELLGGGLPFEVRLQFFFLLVRVESVSGFFGFEGLAPAHGKLVLFFVRVHSAVMARLGLLFGLVQTPAQGEGVGFLTLLLTDV